MNLQSLSASYTSSSAVLMPQCGMVTVHSTLEHMVQFGTGICDGSGQMHKPEKTQLG